MSWALGVVVLGGVLLVIGLVGMGIAMGQVIRRADQQSGLANDDDD